MEIPEFEHSLKRRILQIKSDSLSIERHNLACGCETREPQEREKIPDAVPRRRDRKQLKPLTTARSRCKLSEKHQHGRPDNRVQGDR